MTFKIEYSLPSLNLPPPITLPTSSLKRQSSLDSPFWNQLDTSCLVQGPKELEIEVRSPIPFLPSPSQTEKGTKRKAISAIDLTTLKKKAAYEGMQATDYYKAAKRENRWHNFFEDDNFDKRIAQDYMDWSKKNSVSPETTACFVAVLKTTSAYIRLFSVHPKNKSTAEYLRLIKKAYEASYSEESARSSIISKFINYSLLNETFDFGRTMEIGDLYVQCLKWCKSRSRSSNFDMEEFKEMFIQWLPGITEPQDDVLAIPSKDYCRDALDSMGIIRSLKVFIRSSRSALVNE